MRRLIATLCLMLLTLGLALPAHARVYIDITQPFSKKLPLALTQFQPLPESPADPVGAEGTETLRRYLGYTNLFDFMDPKSFLGNPGLEKVTTAAGRASGPSYSSPAATSWWAHLHLELRCLTSPSKLFGGGATTAHRDLGAMLPLLRRRDVALPGERSIYSP